jgi:hypothetical protein
MHAQVTKKRKVKTARKARETSQPPNVSPLMTNILTSWPGTEEHAFALVDKAAIKGSVTRPGGKARGKKKSDAADIWRVPAGELAKKIWQEFPALPIATVGQRIR